MKKKLRNIFHVIKASKYFSYVYVILIFKSMNNRIEQNEQEMNITLTMNI